MSDKLFSDGRTEPSLWTSPAAGENDVPAAEGQEESPAPKGFGEQLKAAREACGYTAGELVGRLRISVKQIRALETEQVSELPEPVYVRGFIRSYCRAVGIDPVPLVEDYNDRYASLDHPALHQIPEVAYSKEEEFLGRSSSRGWKVAAIVLVVAAVIAGLWALAEQQRMMEKSKTEAAAEKSVQSAPPPPPPAAAPVPPPPVAAAPAPAPKAAEPPRREIAAVADSAPAPRRHVSATVKVALHPQERCYLRLEELSGEKKVAADTEVAAGQAFEVEVRTPFRAIIGYPKDSVFEVDGTRVDLSPFVNSRSGTARLRIY